MPVRPHVGTLGEKDLHASLKRWYREPGDLVEEPVDGFVVDLVRGEQLLEIQTGSFSKMKRKLTTLLGAGHPVRLIHPIAVDTSLVKMGEGGEVLDRRTSPKHGTALDVCAELVSFPHLLADQHLVVEVVLVRQEEVRTHDPTRAWRRKGWVVHERRLLEVLDQVVLTTPTDLLALVPGELPTEFTTADLATAARRPRRLAQQLAYCLRGAGVIEMVDKQGNAIVYRRT